MAVFAGKGSGVFLFQGGDMSVQVAIIMGSRSDLEAMSETFKVLSQFHIEFEALLW